MSDQPPSFSAPSPDAGRATVPAPIPADAVPYLRQLQAALTAYTAGARPGSLEPAFAAARQLVTRVASIRPGDRPDLAEMRRLAETVPEFGTFLSCAADEAGRMVAGGTAQLWRTLGLRSAPPSWTSGEHEAARMLFACAVAPFQDASATRLRAGLRSVAAARIARVMTTELASAEEPWEGALADRYASVRHRCAPRTAWRSRGLSDLLQADAASRQAVARRMEQWLIAGGDPASLAGELEAALVHARTPARFA